MRARSASHSFDLNGRGRDLVSLRHSACAVDISLLTQGGCGWLFNDCLMFINNLPRLLSPAPLQVPQNVSSQLLPSSRCRLPVLRSCCLKVLLVNFCTNKSFMICTLMFSQSLLNCTFLPNCLASLAVAHCLTRNLKDLLLDLAAWNACSTVGYVSLSRTTSE